MRLGFLVGHDPPTVQPQPLRGEPDGIRVTAQGRPVGGLRIRRLAQHVLTHVQGHHVLQVLVLRAAPRIPLRVAPQFVPHVTLTLVPLRRGRVVGLAMEAVIVLECEPDDVPRQRELRVRTPVAVRGQSEQAGGALLERFGRRVGHPARLRAGTTAGHGQSPLLSTCRHRRHAHIPRYVPLVRLLLERKQTVAGRPHLSCSA